MAASIAGLSSALWPVTLALGVFRICDSLFGWSNKIVGRAGILCLSDMTEETIKFVNILYSESFYSNDNWETLRRHLQNLVNLRITGERRFIAVFPNRTSEGNIARNNATAVARIANKMGLFALNTL